jgi:glycosyltransferase involved in cell wall biosynthesis
MERKGIMVLIKSIDFILKKKDLNIKLHIFGSGELDDKISNFILENNLDNYIYSHGHVDNLNEYLIDADFTVFPSLKGEGLMSVVLEAMYYNGVVITTKGNGNEEVIENNKNGFLLDNGDILNNDLVDIILRLHKDVDLRKMIKEKSQQDVLRFS